MVVPVHHFGWWWHAGYRWYMGSLVGESLAHRGVLSNDMNVNHHRLVLEGRWSTCSVVCPLLPRGTLRVWSNGQTINKITTKNLYNIYKQQWVLQWIGHGLRKNDAKDAARRFISPFTQTYFSKTISSSWQTKFKSVNSSILSSLFGMRLYFELSMKALLSIFFCLWRLWVKSWQSCLASCVFSGRTSAAATFKKRKWCRRPQFLTRTMKYSRPNDEISNGSNYH